MELKSLSHTHTQLLVDALTTLGLLRCYGLEVGSPKVGTAGSGGGMPSGPADLPHCNCAFAPATSSFVGGSSSSMCRGLDGICLMTLGSIDEGLLRSCSKCSDHLRCIASLSVSSSPCRFRIGAALLCGGPYTSLKLEWKS
ncbi:hypothetical protein ACOMHN_040768 [Nucella lapillus]